ncbi:MAG TPA: sigma-54 dependent transcriptional regulator [Candidatus Polarisedimenticolia bacterium]|nr:sigma-54 dependent transcriptional regulator [Candidatus Polarisedimenticolia bacterium]
MTTESISSDVDRGSSRILVIDDEETVRDILIHVLTEAGHEVHALPSAEEGLRALEGGSYDLLVLDLMLPGMGGLEMLRAIKAKEPEQIVLMITAFGSVETAVEAMKEGAFDYLSKPFRHEEVLVTVRNALSQRNLLFENRTLRRALSTGGRGGELVGTSRPLQELQRLLDRIAPSRSTVLIQGESGTGKELVAHAIHHRSRRAARPFVVVNSGSVPADLLESNLFGHLKGAFTGAVASKKGLFEVADSGSLFFDEISSIQPEVQAKLLRVIQEREFLPLGAVESLRVDVRIIAATNIDLKELVDQGSFREDLYYRLNVITVKLPPLRDRREDIPLLASHFLRRFALENGRPLPEILPEAMEVLLDHSWPGNVRELENLLERAVVLGGGGAIGLDLLPAEVLSGRFSAQKPPDGDALRQVELDYAETVAQFERDLIEETLQQARGVQRRAAKMLGIKPTTLNEKIKRLGVKLPR